MKENQPQISIIIPVYKTEQYLGKCLESIDAQTYSNYEVILVDDGSPDRSGEICEQYAKKREHVQVIHQKNQGLSMARNNGVQKATGEYITFIDSDDYVTADYLEYLAGLAQKYDAEISAAQDIKVWDNSYPISASAKAARDECFTPAEALTEMCYTRKFRGYAVCKLFRREIAERYPFPPGMLYEDIATIHKMIGAASRTACGTKIIYCYRQSGSSIMRTQFTEKQWDGITAAEQQLEYIRNNYPEATNAAVYKCAARINNYMFMLLKPSGENISVFHRLQKELSKYRDTVYEDPNVRKDFKIRCKAISAGYIPMQAVYRGTALAAKIKHKRKAKEASLSEERK